MKMELQPKSDNNFQAYPVEILEKTFIRCASRIQFGYKKYYYLQSTENREPQTHH